MEHGNIQSVRSHKWTASLIKIMEKIMDNPIYVYLLTFNIDFIIIKGTGNGEITFEIVNISAILS